MSFVERGGTFRVLAKRYGAAEISEVRRQTIGWQKAVSEYLSKGDIQSAVHLLQENKAILWNKKKEDSLNDLLKAWGKDSFLKPHETRQILAHRNIDVDTLNQGARDILRQQGRLGELEVICTTQRGRLAFAAGDRVQFTTTDKEQGLINGYFGTIERIDLKTKNLSIRLDNKEFKEVDPNTYDGLRHGYAATIYKSQGSTLDHIYVLHSKFMNKVLHYVALTRQSKSLSFYASQSETPSLTHLIHQMSQEEGKSTSLNFDTKKDLKKRQEEKSLFLHAKHKAETFIIKIKDLLYRNEDFYKIKRPQSKLLEPAALSSFQHPSKLQEEEQKKDISSNIILLRGTKAPQSINANQVEEALKQNMASFADHILESIGEPYHRSSSTTTERRYGKKGHIAINLRTGAWIDYKDSSLSGGPLHLLTKLKGLSFKEALEYGASWTGLDPEKRNFSLTLTPQKHKKENLEKKAEISKRIEKSQALWQKGKPIQGTLAERYLKEYRKIKGDLPQDLRYLPFFKDKSSGNVYPCLMVAAKSPEGEVTAIQLTFLDPHTAAKTKIGVAKKSFGPIKGSTVTLQETQNSNDKSINVLFVAEGVETALSIKEAGVKGTIKASLGLSNIAKITPENPNTYIVICADHDAPGSPAVANLEKSVSVLQEKGYQVTVIKPDKLGEDFNDLLKQEGPQKIRESLEKSLPNELKQAIFKNPISTTLRSSEGKESEGKALAKGIDEVLQEKNINKQSLPDTHDAFTNLTETCEKYLSDYLKKEKRSLTAELKERVSLQSEKAASFIFHAHTLKGTHPTEEETKLYFLRAKYELDRIPEIRQEIIKDWNHEGHYDEKKHALLAHMIAERQASIEGRLYFEAKYAGKDPSARIPELAEKELTQHRAQTKEMVDKLSQKHSLSENGVTHCAKDILRYKETHGENPSQKQIITFVQIARDLEKTYPYKKDAAATDIFLRLKEGDLLFRQISIVDKPLNSPDISRIQAQAKASLVSTNLQIARDLEKISQKEMI